MPGFVGLKYIRDTGRSGLKGKLRVYTIKRFWMVSLLWLWTGSGNVAAFEHQNTFSLGISQPYLLEPDQKISDTNGVVSYSRGFREHLFADGQLLFGLTNRKSIRFQSGIGIYPFKPRAIRPFLYIAPLFELKPDPNIGFTPRVGLHINTSRVLKIYFTSIKLDLGWNLLYKTPSRAEFDIVRISFGAGF